jgi:hypothetical protein
MNLRTSLAALAIAACAAGAAHAQSATTSGTQGSTGRTGTIASGGSAASGGTGATTLGTGGSSTTPDASSQSGAIGGSAAAADGRAATKSHLNETGNGLNGQAKAQANEGGGTWSKSMTHEKIRDDQLTARTKTMAHAPGEKPVKSTDRQSVDLSGK